MNNQHMSCFTLSISIPTVLADGKALVWNATPSSHVILIIAKPYRRGGSGQPLDLWYCLWQTGNDDLELTVSTLDSHLSGTYNVMGAIRGKSMVLLDDQGPNCWFYDVQTQRAKILPQPIPWSLRGNNNTTGTSPTIISHTDEDGAYFSVGSKLEYLDDNKRWITKIGLRDLSSENSVMVSNASCLYLVGPAFFSIVSKRSASRTVGPSLKVQRRDHCAAVVFDKVVVCFGGWALDSSLKKGFVREIEAWHVDSHESKVIGYWEHPRIGASAVVCNNEVMLFCGGSTSIDSVTIFEAVATHFDSLESLPVRPLWTPPEPSEQDPSNPVSATTTEAHSEELSSAPMPCLVEPPVLPSLAVQSYTSLNERLIAMQTQVDKLTAVKFEYHQASETSFEDIRQHFANEIIRLEQQRDAWMKRMEQQRHTWMTNADRMILELRSEIESCSKQIQNDAIFAKELQRVDHDNFEDGIPSQLRCPITLQLMTDPVVAADGMVYERAALEKWIRAKNVTSPLTGSPLSSLEMFPVQTLKGLCEYYASKQQINVGQTSL